MLSEMNEPSLKGPQEPRTALYLKLHWAVSSFQSMSLEIHGNQDHINTLVEEILWNIAIL
jgi:hypothetical protein